jgi:1-acyl-sn-glycerol-3-phosphate acyltransferase
LITYIRIFFITIHILIIAVLTIIFSKIDYKKKVIHRLSILFGKGILFFAGVKTEVRGLDNLNPKETYIFVSNHLSLFDIPALMSVTPNNIRFIYKKSISVIPILGWAIYLGGYIPIDRQDGRKAIQSIKKASERIKKGISVVIFPEGTRSRTGKIGEFKRGVFLLAEQAKVKIVPVSLKGGDKIMGAGSKKLKKGVIKIFFDKPLDFVSDKKYLGEIRDKIIKNFENSL